MRLYFFLLLLAIGEAAVEKEVESKEKKEVKVREKRQYYYPPYGYGGYGYYPQNYGYSYTQGAPSMGYYNTNNYYGTMGNNYGSYYGYNPYGNYYNNYGYYNRPSYNYGSGGHRWVARLRHSSWDPGVFFYGNNPLDVMLQATSYGLG